MPATVPFLIFIAQSIGKKVVVEKKRQKRVCLHLQKGKRLSGGGVAAMPHLAVYGNLR